VSLIKYVIIKTMVKKFAIIFVFMFSILIFTAYKLHASFDCLTLNNSSSQADKDFCRRELSQIEAQLADLLNKQEEQQKQTGTLQGDINYLTSQINALKTKVKARSLKIAELKVDIKDKVSKIETLSEKIDREHESLAQLLRNTNDFDNKDFIYLIFSDENLSTFYSDLESYASIKQAVKTSVDQIRGIKTETETEKKQLLSISKLKEAEYLKLANEKKARADKIRLALFPLRDAQAIPFGVALDYAKRAEKKTGIRPAFVLAVLKQETNLGANVGSCVITNLSTGETKNTKSGQIFSKGIHPTRDLPLLQEIVKELGRNPLSTVVSCPQSVGF